MNKYDKMLDLYIGELIPPDELLDLIKSKIDMQINNSIICKTTDNYCSDGILNTAVYRRTAETFRRAFSVLEKYNLIFYEGLFVSNEAI
ncbi:MAG: hypothetical protein ACYCWE_12225 [Eubacteriales bacterium]